MASAGRVLIIPKGDYDENSTYEKLDLVKHKGTSWLAKKNVTGVEPVEGEYWQDVFDMEIANNLTTEETGYALDATQGKVLNDKISVLEKYSNNIETEIPPNTHFTCPSDGYFRIHTGTGNYIYGFVNGYQLLYSGKANGTEGYPTTSLFVRKGTVVRFEGSEGTKSWFYPLS